MQSAYACEKRSVSQERYAHSSGLCFDWLKQTEHRLVDLWNFHSHSHSVFIGADAGACPCVANFRCEPQERIKVSQYGRQDVELDPCDLTASILGLM